MKHKLCSLLISAFLVVTTFTVSPPMVFSAKESMVENPQSKQIMPLAEETIWYTRVYNGRFQKRLWSITYERWLTDWIDC